MNSEQVNQRICEMAKASKMPMKNKNEKNLVKGARGGTPTLVKDKTIFVFSGSTPYPNTTKPHPNLTVRKSLKNHQEEA